MTIWANEIKDLDKLYLAFKEDLPDIVREMEQLIRTDDANVVMLYSRRCLEVIVTDLCETELHRPRKTEPLKGIIDKLNSEEKVPSHIVASMQSLNSMATFGAHPKDFDPEQVKPVLNNLAIVIKWYLKYKNFQIVSLSDLSEKTPEPIQTEFMAGQKAHKDPPKKKKIWKWVISVALLLFASFVIGVLAFGDKEDDRFSSIEAYKTVKIGNQVWMAENLQTTNFTDGTPIPLVKDDVKWENLTSPAYCWYGNDKDNRETYGALYNWYTVSTGKLCPAGWHVPTDKEWSELIFFLGDSLDWIESEDSLIIIPKEAGIKLKEAGNAHWELNDTIFAKDEYGFRALPGGFRSKYGACFDIGKQGSWWTSTEDGPMSGDAKNFEMYSEQNDVTDIQQYKQFGMSVRCIKD